MNLITPIEEIPKDQLPPKWPCYSFNDLKDKIVCSVISQDILGPYFVWSKQDYHFKRDSSFIEANLITKETLYSGDKPTFTVVREERPLSMKMYIERHKDCPEHYKEV